VRIEAMNIPFSNSGDTKSIHTLLSIGEDDAIQWHADDLEPIWRLLLDASLDEVVPGPGMAHARAEGGPGPGTLRERLLDSSAPVEGLRLLKDFAKEQGSRPDALLPREVCSALYYICIQLAGRDTGQRMTSLSPEAIRKGVDWVLEQPWIDAGLKQLLRDAD